ncbi:MAG: hypothetical protein AB9828_08535 [Sphaerochaetaceae bacterium]|jgi:hypothetical protein
MGASWTVVKRWAMAISLEVVEQILAHATFHTDATLVFPPDMHRGTPGL